MTRIVPGVRDWEGAVVETIESTIPMQYPGGGISKNRLWNGGDRRHGMTREARDWKATLAMTIGWHLLSVGAQAVVSVEGTIGGTFLDKGHAPDLHNLIELVADSVEEATGVVDRDHTWRTLPAEYDRDAVPEIRVGLKLGVIRRAE